VPLGVVSLQFCQPEIRFPDRHLRFGSRRGVVNRSFPTGVEYPFHLSRWSLPLKDVLTSLPDAGPGFFRYLLLGPFPNTGLQVLRRQSLDYASWEYAFCHSSLWLKI